MSVLLLIMVLGVYLLFAKNQKVKVKVMKEVRWTLSREAPLAKEYPFYILISPDYEKLLAIYSVIGNKYDDIKCYIRIFSANGKNKSKDIVLPSGCFVDKAEWSPDSQKILLCGWRENTLNSLVFVLNLKEWSLSSIPQIFQFWYPVRLVSISSVFNPASDALVLPKELNENKAYLIIADPKGNTKRLITGKEIERFFTPTGIICIGWDEKGNALWLGKEGIGVFKVSLPEGTPRKVYDFPSLHRKPPSWALIEPYTGKLLLWEDRITKGGKPPIEAEYRLTMTDLKTNRRLYEDCITYRFPRGEYSMPHSKHSRDGKAVWFWSGYSGVPFHIWFIEGDRVEKVSFRLPIPRGEGIVDIQWGNGMLYVTTYNWRGELRKSPPQKMVKLYKIAVSFTR